MEGELREKESIKRKGRRGERAEIERAQIDRDGAENEVVTTAAT